MVPKRDGTQMAPSTLKSQWWNWVARQKIDSHLPIHGLRDSFGTGVYEEDGVKQAQEWLGHSDPAITLRHCVRLTAATRAKAAIVAGGQRGRPAALTPRGYLFSWTGVPMRNSPGAFGQWQGEDRQRRGGWACTTVSRAMPS